MMMPIYIYSIYILYIEEEMGRRVGAMGYRRVMGRG